MPSEETEGPLSPDDARLLVGNAEAQVIDIREDADAFAEGHLAGAVHVPGGDPEALPDDISEDKVLLLVCEAGERSADLAEKWQDEGRRVAYVQGGMEAWASSGMPTQPRDEAEFDGPDLRPPGT